MPSFEEIRAVVFDMDPSSALGPNGFTGPFFRSCWEIVGSNVVQVI